MIEPHYASVSGPVRRMMMTRMWAASCLRVEASCAGDSREKVTRLQLAASMGLYC